ncbi:MAG TPA: glycoside hydrolase family 16 protein [Tepidisphaeraceae bacterium]|nr:glycoside hydrolase family 16 protein [Tepidisphaeraceae bacterium]
MPTQAEDSGGWKLVWGDNFQGNQIDRRHWTFDLGNGQGWGNKELEYFTSSPANAFVKGGLLHVRALRQADHGYQYTSARLTTRDLFSAAYGRFEFRAKLPTGQGIWPAIWLMPVKDSYGPWPASGEIDVLEARHSEPGNVVSTIHYGSPWPAVASASVHFHVPGGIDRFHIYTLDWEPGVIRWYVDGKLFEQRRNWWSGSRLDRRGEGVATLPASDRNHWPAPFDKKFYIILSLSVGGTFGGPPDPRVFPQEMNFSFVRVYEKAGYGRLPPPARLLVQAPRTLSPPATIKPLAILPAMLGH